MNASLLFQTMLRRAAPLAHRMEFRIPPPPPPATSDGDEEPERKSEPQFWTLFIENPRPNSIHRDNSD